MSRQKQKVKVVSEKPHQTGLECPLCGGRTLSRDVAPDADGWYVEWCSGGTIIFWNIEEVDGKKEDVRYEFECPYVSAGFLGKGVVR